VKDLGLGVAYFRFCFVLVDWFLNSGLHACKAGTTACLQVHFLVSLGIGSLELFAQAGLEPRSS
jgi:hypothetical protein